MGFNSGLKGLIFNSLSDVLNTSSFLSIFFLIPSIKAHTSATQAVRDAPESTLEHIRHRARPCTNKSAAT